ncbi:MAG: PAS domain S-box protein [Microcoleus sp. PH2017_10_PVI_O_A]|uniref:PAS domain S-box protein n=1 Tax=unclassified Microcoleus TaxID=2642155 RepID=UPI001D671F4C|nr:MULTISPECIES: PAS domain S-box protein [unclassified Microcoleus]TAE73386.1 MAG: PAS domain S-box protein [Oscillatoriales cyanobacterium]MCC3409957.1 PAS domain S-box protein [Microcoleus sp. PH2017_10_PVI_O_A]MCC3464219.1 PAS domain S-box protein [Microcoleus sp. PH2017_11_PCY_U_A]MCC3482562.1 PAS domain S-box protein [Microcoleus sp. PH2017_12_PCY_D_A]MCC3563560.1 PAS domain S-box protein [Microcoleus sp. PH2017_27_LUM_O_A]
MLETIYKYLETLQEQVNHLPPPQQAILTKTVENLSNSLQEMAAGRQFESATNNAAKLVEAENLNRLLERTIAQQGSQLRQLQEKLDKEISQHRRDNQAFTKSEAKLQTVLRHSPDIISIVGADGRVRYHSAALESVLGYKPEERIGKFHGELMHPDDLLAWRAYFGNLLEYPGVGRPIEYRKRHANGSWIYLEAIGNSLLHDSSVQGIVINSREIGERKQAEIAVRESESHYIVMSKITSDFAYSFKVLPDGKFACEWATEAFERCAGRVPEKLESFGWWNSELVHPDDREILIKQLEGCTFSRTGANEYRIINQKGEVRWVRDCWQVVWDKTEGRVVRLWGACQEITDRKQVEFKLQQVNEVLQAQMASAPLAINCTGNDGRTLVWNRAAEELFGWTAAEVLGQPLPNIPEGQKQDFYALLKSAGNGKLENGLELSLLKKDGSSIDVWLWAALVQDAGGDTLGSINIFSDPHSADIRSDLISKEFRILKTSNNCSAII